MNISIKNIFSSYFFHSTRSSFLWLIKWCWNIASITSATMCSSVELSRSASYPLHVCGYNISLQKTLKKILHKLGPWWLFSHVLVRRTCLKQTSSCFLMEKPASVSCIWPPVWTTTHSLLVNPDFLFQHVASWHPYPILSLASRCMVFPTGIELPTRNAGVKERFLPLFQELYVCFM